MTRLELISSPEYIRVAFEASALNSENRGELMDRMLKLQKELVELMGEQPKSKCNHIANEPECAKGNYVCGLCGKPIPHLGQSVDWFRGYDTGNQEWRDKIQKRINILEFDIEQMKPQLNTMGNIEVGKMIGTAVHRMNELKSLLEETT